MIEQFITELKIQMTIHHENVCKIYHCFSDHEKVYLVMEYCNEGNLFYKLKKEKMIKERQARVYIREIASALEVLHDSDISHRDLKP